MFLKSRGDFNKSLLLGVQSGAIIRDGDRKLAPFLVLGLAP